MATQFNIPSSPKKLVYQSDTFLGADFTSEASTVDDTKSPNCENVIRSVPGKIRKRMGYKKVANYEQPIFGVHYYSLLDTYLVHAGTGLYDLKAIRGAQWEVSYIPNITLAEVQEFYSGVNVRCVVDESGKRYQVIENLVYMIPGATPLTLSPYPNFVETRVEKQFIINERYHYVHYFDPDTEASADVITEVPENIYLLDGSVINTRVGDGLNGHRSTSFELGQKLIILDGQTMWMFDGDGLHRMSDGPGTERLIIPSMPMFLR